MDPSTEEVRADIEATRERMGGTLEAIGDRVSPGRVIERRANRARNWGRSMSDRFMGTADDARSAVTDRAGDASHGLAQVPSSVQSRTAASPLVAGAIAFGIGFIIGGALPASDPEQRLSEKALDAARPLADELKQAGTDVAEHLKEPVMDAVEQVKGSATDAVDEVKGTAQDGIDRTKEAAANADGAS